MENKNIILGAGISALIWAYYHKDYIVMGKKIGGQMNSSFELGPRVLHKNKFTARLLKSLGFPLTTEEIEVGYEMVHGVLYPKAPEGFLEKYYFNSRGRKYSGDETALSGGESVFKVYKTSLQEVAKKLQEVLKNRIFEGEVQNINLNNKMLTFNGEDLKFEKLVSSVPLNVFIDLTNSVPRVLHAKDVTYVKCKNFIPNSFYFNYIYFSNRDYHRATIHKDYVVLEFLGKRSECELQTILKDNFLDSKVLKNSQIESLESPIEFDGVKLIGRYGTWDRSWKVEKVVEEASSWKK